MPTEWQAEMKTDPLFIWTFSSMWKEGQGPGKDPNELLKALQEVLKTFLVEHGRIQVQQSPVRQHQSVVEPMSPPMPVAPAAVLQVAPQATPSAAMATQAVGPSTGQPVVPESMRHDQEMAEQLQHALDHDEVIPGA